VEQIAGQGFDDYVQQHVLDPIGMSHSSFVRTSDVERNLAPAYMWNMDGEFPAPLFDMTTPPGNLFSTVSDMAEFVKVLLRGGYTRDGKSIVRPATLHEMWKPLGYHGKMGYGLCFASGSLDGWKTVGHGGAVYGFATQCLALPEAQIGVVMCATLDAANVVISRLSAYALRLMLAGKGMGERPARPGIPDPVSERQLESLPGFYCCKDKDETIEVRAKEERLYVLGDSVPLRIQPVSEWDFTVDGRVFGPGSDYPHLEVSFTPPAGHTHKARAMMWQKATWERVPKPAPKVVPDRFKPYIGKYGPDFNPTYLFYQGGGLRCLIVYFFTHTLEEVSEGVYKMHGLLYENDLLVLDATDKAGNPGIRVGPMFLKRWV